MIALFVVAMVANAKVLVSYEHTATAPEGITLGGTTVFKSVKIHTNTDAVDCIQLANGYTTESQLNGNNIEVAVEGGFKAGDVVSIAGFFNNAEDTKNSQFVIYVLDSSDAGYSVLWTSEKLINGRLVADDPRVDTYTLEQDCEKFYIARSGNTGTNLYSLNVTRVEAGGGKYEASITSDPEEIYYSGYQAFDMAKVIEDLGLADEAALQALVAAGGNVYIKTADGLSNSYTGNTNEFWMNANGIAQGYGDEGSCWYAGLYYDEAGSNAETGESWPAEFYCKVGQMPGYFKKVYTASTLNVVLVLKNGSLEAEFDITLNVNPAPEPTLPAPETDLSKVNVVKEYSTTLDFTTGKEYENNTITVDMADLAEALGVTAEDLASNIQDITLTEKMNSVTNEETQETTNTPSGTLDTPANLAGGSWFGRYSNYDEATGETVTYTQSYSHAWGANATFYVQNIAFADGSFSFTTGQYKNTMAAGAKDFAVLYILNGDKAAKLTINVNVTDPETIDPTAMVKVGESTVSITANIDDSYVTKAFTVDMEAICAALGCSASDIADVFAYAQDGSISDNHTESTGGYYYNEDGKIESWGNNAAFFIAKGSLSNGEYSIGQMKGHYTTITEDKTCTAQLIFQYGQNFYVVNVEYTVKAPQQGGEVEYTCVGSNLMKMQIVPSESDWAWGTTASIDLNWVKDLIGTEEFTLYTDKATTAEDGTVSFAWAKNYTCDPAPGFWYGTTEYTNPEGQVVVDNAGWGTNSFGISYANGIVTFYQYPSQRAVGDNYTANLYLVNEETGDYIKYVVKVKYVSEVGEDGDIAQVGSESLLVNFDTAETDADGLTTVTLPLDDACAAFGIDPEELEAAQVTVPDSPGSYNTVQNFEEEFTLAENGYYTQSEEKIASTASLYLEDGKVVLKYDDIIGKLDTEEAAASVVRIALVVGGQAYLYEVTMGNTAYITETAISSASTSATAASIYSISGAKMNTLQKGINIVKMSDGSVRKVINK